jgi:hypothetical protein
MVDMTYADTDLWFSPLTARGKARARRGGVTPSCAGFPERNIEAKCHRFARSRRESTETREIHDPAVGAHHAHAGGMPNLYQRVLQLNQAASHAHEYEVAYHLLAAALHAAKTDSQIDEVVQRATEQQSEVDAQPEHRLSASQAQKRGNAPLFGSLVLIANARRADMKAHRALRQSRALKGQFDAAHAKGMKALSEGNYEAFDKAMRREGEVVDAQDRLTFEQTGKGQRKASR